MVPGRLHFGCFGQGVSVGMWTDMTSWDLVVSCTLSVEDTAGCYFGSVTFGVLLSGVTGWCYSCWVLLWVAVESATCPEASQLLEFDVRVSIAFSSGADPMGGIACE